MNEFQAFLTFVVTAAIAILMIVLGVLSFNYGYYEGVSREQGYVIDFQKHNTCTPILVPAK